MDSAGLLADNPRAVAGDNMPPPSPYEACKAHMDDLLTEAHNWADGQEITTQAQADEVERLKEDLRLSGVAADDCRVVEQKPWTDLISESQEKWNAYIAPLKNKKPGKVMVAMDALRATLTPWKQKLEAEARAKAEAARREAQEAADKAAEAMRASQASDIESREAAEALVNEAARKAADAKRAESAKVTGLRSFWTPVMTDRREALKHYLTTNPDAVVGFLQQLAEQDVRAGKRQIAGFEIKEERRV